MKTFKLSTQAESINVVDLEKWCGNRFGDGLQADMIARWARDAKIGDKYIIAGITIQCVTDRIAFLASFAGDEPVEYADLIDAATKADFDAGTIDRIGAWAGAALFEMRFYPCNRETIEVVLAHRTYPTATEFQSWFLFAKLDDVSEPTPGDLQAWLAEWNEKPIREIHESLYSSFSKFRARYVAPAV